MTMASFSLTRRSLFAAVPGALVGGCAVIHGPLTPQLYVLRPPQIQPGGAPVRWALSVAIPDAPASLDTVRIALARSSSTMDFFADSAWTDRVPLQLQRLLVLSFEDSGRIPGVDRDTAGLESDYMLETAVRDFQARYDTPDAAPTVEVGIQAKLVKMPQRQIVGNLNVRQQVQSSANSVDATVAAFNQATGAALAQIVNWTFGAVPA